MINIEWQEAGDLCHVAKTVSGWLVRYSGSITYVPDPEHLSFAPAEPSEPYEPIDPVEPAPVEPEPEEPVEPEEPAPVEPEPDLPVEPEPEDPVEPEPVEPDPTPVEPEPEPELPTPVEPEEPAEPEPEAPAPVEPEPVPEPTEVKVVVFDDALQNGFADHSWAVVDKSHNDAYEGQKSILVDADAWSALNLRHPTENFSTEEYTGISFAIKADAGDPKIQLALQRDYDALFTLRLNALLPAGRMTAEYQHIRINFADHGAPIGVFNSVLFQGLSGGDQPPFKIDEITLYKTPVVAVEPGPTPEPVDPVPMPSTGGWLRTEGNRILDENGNEWQGKGANIFDSRSCWACSFSQPNVEEVKRRIDNVVDDWGATFLRLCLETDPSVSVQNQGLLQSEQYANHIKEIVDHIGTKPGVYVLVSLWHDPTFTSLGWPSSATLPVLKKLSEMFMGDSHVMYGVCNEPEMNFNGLLNASAHAAMVAAVQAIREVEDQNGAPHHLIAVQGLAGWGRDLSYYIQHPINFPNVIFETHVYNSPSDYNRMVAVPKQTLPVIIGELGPVQMPEIGVSMSEADCQTLMNLANDLKVPYLGWAYHMRCPPNMLVDYSNGGCGTGMALEPTSWGTLLKNNL